MKKKTLLATMLAALASCAPVGILFVPSSLLHAQSINNSADPRIEVRADSAHSTDSAESQLPHLGEEGTMSLGDERQLGDQIAKQIYRSPLYLSDPVLDAYLARLWQPLYAQAKKNGNLSAEMDAQFAWRLFLVRDKSFNAFAFPGGYVGVHLGLISPSETPDALASVLAHELTHVTQRHIARRMSVQKTQAPLAVAGILLGLLVATGGGNHHLANALLTGAPALSIQNQLSYSRDFEREADRLGLALMAPAGYDPQGFVEMFSLMGKASRLSDGGDFPYLRTHPLTTERMADMNNRVRSFAPAPAPVPAPAPAHAAPREALQLHRLMAARANVLADTSVDALKHHINQAQAATPATASHAVLYAAALAAWLSSEPARAQVFYDQLKASLSVRTPPSVLEAVRYLGLEIGAPSVIAPDLNSTSRVEMLYAALQVINQKSAAKTNSSPSPSQIQAVVSRLQLWTSSHPQDIDAWHLLARGQLLLGQRVRANMSTAEAMRAQLNDSGALEQYLVAQNLIRQGIAADSVDTAIIDVKVRELQAKIKAQN